MAFYLYGGDSVFLSSPQIRKKAFFNRVSNSYTLRTRIPVSGPRARTLELPLLVMSAFFLVFFLLSPGRKRPVFVHKYQYNSVSSTYLISIPHPMIN